MTPVHHIFYYPALHWVELLSTLVYSPSFPQMLPNVPRDCQAFSHSPWLACLSHTWAARNTPFFLGWALLPCPVSGCRSWRLLLPRSSSSSLENMCCSWCFFTHLLATAPEILATAVFFSPREKLPPPLVRLPCLAAVPSLEPS